MGERIISWYRNLGFRKKVLFSHLAVSLIPVIVLGTFCYHQTRNLLIRREKEVLLESLEQSSLGLDSSLNAYKYAVDSLAWDARIKQALAKRYENNLEMYLAYRDVIDPTIRTIRSLNPRIGSITIYSGNDTLFPHGDVLRPLNDLENGSSLARDYSLHWLAEGNRLKLCCGIYPENGSGENLVYMEVEGGSVFEPLKELFGENYGVLAADGEGRTVFSYRVMEEGMEGQPLTLTELQGENWAEDYVMEATRLVSNGWTIYLYRPLSAVSASAASITVLIAIAVICCLGLIFGASFLLSGTVVKPLQKLIRNIDQIEDGNLSAQVQEESRDEIGCLIGSFRRMVDRLNYMVNENYKSRIAQKEYEMKALQAQINPHFLYNSLSLINWKAIMAGQEEISQMAQLLSTFYRTTLNKGKNITTVKGEWDNTCSYVQIQNLMHSGKMRVETRIDPEMLEYEMLNLLLQPLVENAVVHGLDHKTEAGEKILRVRGELREGELIFTVEDNGCGMEENVLKNILAADAGGYGVQNVQHRIQLYYGPEYGLSYESKINEGTRALLRIPARKREP